MGGPDRGWSCGVHGMCSCLGSTNRVERVLTDRGSMRFVVGLIVATLSAAAWSGGARASDGDVEALYRQVLRSPTDTQTNLRYARAAEASGNLRWALAAYERMLLNDPDNADVQQGLQRIRRKLQPNTTQFSLEVGGIYESNP